MKVKIIKAKDYTSNIYRGIYNYALAEGIKQFIEKEKPHYKDIQIFGSGEYLTAVITYYNYRIEREKI